MPPRFFEILSTKGVQMMIKLRPIDILFEILLISLESNYT